ncbi:MAG: phenylalanine--tRNA ligase subunit beta [Bacteroidales bacterium]|nr:phenylalanine--tRNA ligase subunit beta [Bacteroidales bacterium]
MEISYKWLKRYLPTDLPEAKVSALLTDCGLEIETMETYESIRGGLENVCIGKVLTCEAHPNSDHLHLTTVDVGREEPLHIVCGAPNVAEGQHVVTACIGATLYPSDGEPLTIKKSKIRGEVSEGMLCAADELGIGSDHDGILVLPETAVPGTPAKTYFQVETDTVFGIGLTPNRSDAICHIGVARDLAASIHCHLGKKIPLRLPDLSAFPENGHANPVSIDIQDNERCPRYSGLHIRNVRVQESPDWLKSLLKTVGIRPINNIVDITQFVMLECGQPMHAFDTGKIKGNQVIIRRARPEEPFRTLDGIDRKLDVEDLVICDSNDPMCLAGVMGGEWSGISDTTTEVFLESAYFQAAGIRKTAKRHTLKTDASFRYERGCDPNITVQALKRAALLIRELAGGEISALTDVYPKTIQKAQIIFPLSYLNALAGQTIEKEMVCQILNDLEIDIRKDENGTLTLAVPTNKVDVTRPADVAEEVLRIYGYNRIDLPSQFEYRPSVMEENPLLAVKERMSAYLSDNGFFEIMNNSLTRSEYAERFDFISPEETVHLMNPLSKDLQDMRQSLLFGGLESIARNINHGNTDLRMYEFGTVYRKDKSKTPQDSVLERYPHHQRLALWASGQLQSASWQAAAEESDFFYLKNMVLNSLHKARFQTQRLKVETVENTMGLAYALQYRFRQQLLLTIGEVDTETLKYFGIKQPVYYAEIDCDALMRSLEPAPIRFRDLNRFPEVDRDLALLVDKSVTYAQLEKIAFQTDPAVKEVNLFDVYEGKNLEAGKKSYALSFRISNPERTFTADEVQAIMDKLIRAYEKEANAKLR